MPANRGENFNMAKLILMRHGQSLWNEHNLFTGWVDISLSPKGIEEAFIGGDKIKEVPIDVAFTSTLVRAQMTTMLALSMHCSGKVPLICHPGEGQVEEWATIYSNKAAEACIPIYIAWQLNERMYGSLQGLNKAETIEKYGAEQVHIWRRSFSVPPPGGESLEMTAARTLPYFHEKIVPHLAEGKNVFISAHGNSLRAIIMFLEKIPPEEIPNLELATGAPIFYDYSQSIYTRENNG
jgi:2,3-bisphosphoglycerate-dependent phosphoglycerate mutase